MEKILRENLKVISNNKIAGNYFKIVLGSAQIIRFIRPGQFLEIRVSKGCQPLLRRPFSTHSKQRKQIGILYEAVGQATEILSKKRTGEYLDAIGPLGNGFSYQLPVTSYQLPVLVSGGMGVAPLIFLAEKLMERKTQNAKRKTLVLIGAKAENQILCEKEFKRLGCDVKISTDDGSRGFKGKVTDLLKSLLWTMDYGLWTIYACGPRPMLKETSLISKRYNIPAQLSLEEHMACGIGACLGCVVNTRKGYKRVCKEGPVFNADEIIW